MEQQSDPIVENLWWVIPGKLAGVRKPTAAELPELERVGIGAIVSVIHDESNLELYQQENIPYLWLPIQIASSPNRSQIAELTNFVNEHHRQGVGIAVHCTGGLHRTGTMLAAYLIAAGSSYRQAMQIVQDANPDAELRVAQTTFLRELAGG